MLIHRYIKGIFVLWEALRLLLSKPRLLRYCIYSCVVSCLAYFTILAFTFSKLNQLFNNMLPEITNSDWLSILVQIIGIFLFLIAFFYFAGYTFFSITKLVSAPFNDLLSEKVEEMSNDQYQVTEGSISHFLNSMFPTVFEELKKLALIFSGFAALYIATLLPLLNVIAIPLLMVYSVLVVAIDFLDYPMARRHMNLSDKIQMVKRFVPELLGFGTITFTLFLIPLFGLIILQLAVIGATLLFIQFEKEKKKAY